MSRSNSEPKRKASASAIKNRAQGLPVWAKIAVSLLAVIIIVPLVLFGVAMCVPISRSRVS